VRQGPNFGRRGEPNADNSLRPAARKPKPFADADIRVVYEYGTNGIKGRFPNARRSDHDTAE
jgi:hypothetical protein